MSNFKWPEVGCIKINWFPELTVGSGPNRESSVLLLIQTIQFTSMAPVF